jgi:hypothetical protein
VRKRIILGFVSADAFAPQAGSLLVLSTVWLRRYAAVASVEVGEGR